MWNEPQPPQTNDLFHEKLVVAVHYHICLGLIQMDYIVYILMFCPTQ